MANTIQIKRSTTAGDNHALAAGELGVNLTDEKLWVGDGTNNLLVNPTSSLGDTLYYSQDAQIQISDDSTNSNYHTMREFHCDRVGSFRIKFSAYIVSGTYWWAWRVYNATTSTVLYSGSYTNNLDTGESAQVHQYRRYKIDVDADKTRVGDKILIQMVSSNSGGTPVAGDGQNLTLKEFRVYLNRQYSAPINTFNVGAYSLPPISGALSGNIDSKPDSYTKLLLHSDTTDGRGTFTDSSPSGHAITASGNTRHETDYSKFGATSIFIPNATSDTVNIPLHSDFEFTGDFTIDMWVNVPSGGDRSLYVQSDSSTYLAFNYSKSATQFNLYINGGGASQTPSYDLVGWNHVAWIRSGNQLVLYVNGTAINTVTNSATLGYAAGNQTINRLGGGAATTPHYCDEVRISKGIARWTAAFTPPTRPYATFSAGDGVFTGELVAVGGATLTGALASTGRMILDSATDGDIRFHNSGTHYGQIFQSTDMYIRSVVSDKDIIFTGNDGGNYVNALTLDMSAGGAAAFSGAVTWPSGGSANANTAYTYSQVGHLPLAGGTLTGALTVGTINATGDFTLDSADGIILDADGGSISLKDGGTRFGILTNSSSNFVLENPISDKDILFKVKDDSTTITALSLDGSDNGAAAFSGEIDADNGIDWNAVGLTGRVKGRLGWGSGFVYMGSVAADAITKIVSGNGVAALTLAADQSAAFSGAVTWSGGGSANANTAYTYSQVGHLPLAGGTLTGALTGTSATFSGLFKYTNSAASNDTGDLKIIPSASASGGVGYATQIIGVNIADALSNNFPKQFSTWGGVTGSSAIALNADDNSYGQFMVLTAPQGSSANTELTPRFWITGAGTATFSGNLTVIGAGVAKQISANAYSTADFNNWYTGHFTFGQLSRYNSTYGHWRDSSNNVAANAPDTPTSPLTSTAPHNTAAYAYGGLLTLGSTDTFRGQMYMSHSGSELYWRSGWGASSDQNWVRLVNDRNIPSLLAASALTSATFSGLLAASSLSSGLITSGLITGRYSDYAVANETAADTTKYGWTSYGNNTVAVTSGQIVITRVDNSAGAYRYFRTASPYHLTSDLIVDEYYTVTVKLKYSGASAPGVRVYDGAAYLSGFATLTTSLATYTTTFQAKHATDAFIVFYSLPAANDTITVDDLTIRGAATFGNLEATGALTVAGTALFSDGLVGSPSISFAGDTDTGIWRPGSNQLWFVTTGVNRLKLDASGNAEFTGDVTVGGNLAVTGTIDCDTLDGIDSSQFIRSDVNDTVTNHTTWSDNNKVRFGDGPDLEIYHDGSNSYIKDVGTGGLKLMGGAIYLRNPSDQDMIYCSSGAEVKLYHNNAQKLTTASTGVDVTGYLKIADVDTGVGWGDLNTGIFGRGTANTNSYLQFRVNGGTAAIHIDSSKNVGIGTAAPGTYQLYVAGTTYLGNDVTIGDGKDLSVGGVFFAKSNSVIGSLSVGSSITSSQSCTIGGYSVQYDAGGSGARLTNTGFLQFWTEGAWSSYERKWAFTNGYNMGFGSGGFALIRSDAPSTLPTLVDSGEVGANTQVSTVWDRDGDAKFYGAVTGAFGQPAALGDYLLFSNDAVGTAVDSSTNADYNTVKAFRATVSGAFRMKWSAYIQGGTWYWAYRIYNATKGSLIYVGHWNRTFSSNHGLDSGQSGSTHAYRRFKADVTTAYRVTVGDLIQVQMVSSNHGGTPSNGNGQTLYAKELRIYTNALGDVATAAKSLPLGSQRTVGTLVANGTERVVEFAAGVHGYNVGLLRFNLRQGNSATDRYTDIQAIDAQEQVTPLAFQLAGGGVGIGTVTPGTHALYVTGTTYLGNDVTIGAGKDLTVGGALTGASATFGSATTTSNVAVRIETDNASTYTPALQLAWGGDVVAEVDFQFDTRATTGFKIGTTAATHPVSLVVDDVPKIYISGYGNVGINSGTTTPIGTLQVNDTSLSVIAGTVTVDRAATNKFTNGDFASDGTGWTFGSWTTASYSYTFPAFSGSGVSGFSKVCRIERDASGGVAHFHQGGIFANSTVFSVGLWVRGDGTFRINSHWGILKTLALTSTWQYMTVTTTSNATSGHFIYLAADLITTYCEVTGVMIEQAATASTFTDVSRSSGDIVLHGQVKSFGTGTSYFKGALEVRGGLTVSNSADTLDVLVAPADGDVYMPGRLAIGGTTHVAGKWLTVIGPSSFSDALSGTSASFSGAVGMGALTGTTATFTSAPVVIGAASGAGTLHLQHDTNGPELWFERADSSLTGRMGLISFGNRNYDDHLCQIRATCDSTAATAAGGGGYLSFDTEESGGNLTERFRIAANGSSTFYSNVQVKAPAYGGGTGGVANIDLRTTTALSGSYGGGTAFSKKYLLQVLMPGDATQNDTNSRLIRLQIPGGYAHAACGGSGTIKIAYMQSHYGGVAAFEFKFAQLKGEGTNNYATKNWGDWKIQKTNQILETSSYFTQTQINYVVANLTFERYRPSTNGGSAVDVSALLIKLPNSGTLRVRDIVVEVNFTGANNWESNIGVEDIGWYATNVPSNYAAADRTTITPVELWLGDTAEKISTSSAITVGGAATFDSTVAITGALSPLGSTNYNDNCRAKFGNGNDLQIYHDTNHSYIEDTGTGALKLKSDDFRVENSSGNNLFKGLGSVASLYFNGSEKLATVTGGVDVTGALVATGVVSGAIIDGKVRGVNSSSNGTKFLELEHSMSADPSYYKLLLPQDYNGNNGGHVKLTVIWHASHASSSHTQVVEFTYGTSHTRGDDGHLEVSPVAHTHASDGADSYGGYPIVPTLKLYRGVVEDGNGDCGVLIKVGGKYSYNTARTLRAEITGKNSDGGNSLTYFGTSNEAGAVALTERTNIGGYDGDQTGRYVGIGTGSRNQWGVNYSADMPLTVVTQEGDKGINLKNSSGVELMQIRQEAGDASMIILRDGGNAKNLFTSRPSNDSYFNTDSGGVAIGSTAAAPWKLYVNGITKINGALEVNGQLAPTSGNTYDLGNSTNTWRNLYLKGTAEIDSTLTIGGVLTSTSSATFTKIHTTAHSAVSTAVGDVMSYRSDAEYTVDHDSGNQAYYPMKSFRANKSGAFRIRWSCYIQAGTYYLGYRIYNATTSTVLYSGGAYSTAGSGNGLDDGQVGYVHAYRRFRVDVAAGKANAGDLIELGMVSATYGGGPVNGNGQRLYAKEFRITASAQTSGIQHIDGNVGIGGGTNSSGLKTLNVTQTGPDYGIRLNGHSAYPDSHINLRVDSSGHTNFETSGGSYTRFGIGSGYFLLTTAANEPIYMDFGGSFYWRDRDAANAIRMSLNSADGALQVNGPTTISTASTTTRLKITSAGSGGASDIDIDVSGGTYGYPLRVFSGAGGSMVNHARITTGGDIISDTGRFVQSANDSNPNSLYDTNFSGTVRPSADNTYALGNASYRWSSVNAAGNLVGDNAILGGGVSAGSTISTTGNITAGATLTAVTGTFSGNLTAQHATFQTANNTIVDIKSATTSNWYSMLRLTSNGSSSNYIRTVGELVFDGSGSGIQFQKNVGIGAIAHATHGLYVQGSSQLVGHLTGTSATFSSYIRANYGIQDDGGSYGTSGQVLKSGGTGVVNWANESGGGGGVTGGNTGISIYNSTTVQLDVSGSDSCVNVHTAITSPSIDDYMIISDESASNDPVQKCKIRHLPLAKSSTFSASGCGGWLYMHNPNGVQQDSTSISLTCSGGGGS